MPSGVSTNGPSSEHMSQPLKEKARLPSDDVRPGPLEPAQLTLKIMKGLSLQTHKI